RAGPPHAGDLLPVTRVVLHFSPDEVVAGIRHRAICRRIGGAQESTARQLGALLHLEPHRIPNLRGRRRIECRAVLPRGWIEYSSIDRAGRRDAAGVAVLSGWSRQRERRRARCRVTGVRIGGGPTPGGGGP